MKPWRPCVRLRVYNVVSARWKFLRDADPVNVSALVNGALYSFYQPPLRTVVTVHHARHTRIF